ncbi:hypothetical protein EYF80_027844 [Liparis tanakae]|uniref:Uncharacterized protein n=1 Tax=Liparis tanakae TaxID=230148 RepID=A0A4Z2H7N1_9TELE|nr:hypothetical protein EYF80_027844 [Liparis tanakae]
MWLLSYVSSVTWTEKEVLQGEVREQDSQEQLVHGGLPIRHCPVGRTDAPPRRRSTLRSPRDRFPFKPTATVF